MKPLRAALPVLFFCTTIAHAQDAAPVYQKQKSSVGFHLDGLVRQEWTQDIFLSSTDTRNEQRRLFRLKPRLELGGDHFMLGVGGEFNFGSDRNVDPRPTLLRDNYDSREARLDLAFARIEPVRFVRLEGGRFRMPVALTEMTWDRDLRPQGGALTLQDKDDSGVTRFGLTGLWAKGSHVFEDDSVQLLLGSAQVHFAGQGESGLQLVGSFLYWKRVDTLEPMIRRQNSRVLGEISGDYHVVDLVARLRTASQVPFQLVANYCWNTAIDSSNRGLWLAAVLGSLDTSRMRAEYTFARVDKDATLAAFATDDFFWGTGWRGHRGELSTKTNEHSSLALVGQLQQFKDSPRPEERDHWVKRLRVELRATY
jgi:Putative porin